MGKRYIVEEVDDDKPSVWWGIVILIICVVLGIAGK
jgi:hypothetical protein